MDTPNLIRKKKSIAFVGEAYEAALAIVQKLRDHGFEAYFAGGSVRDGLLGRTPNDFDVATNAVPPVVQTLFPNTLPIGAAFGVIQVRSHGLATEVATFRQDQNYVDGRRPQAVTFSSAAEDALRRDFTVNALFYDPIQEEIIDYVGGEVDLSNGVIRTVGKAEDRFREDHLRILRALRFECQLGFAIDAETRAAVQQMMALVQTVSRERLAVELHKIFQAPFSENFFANEGSGILSSVLNNCVPTDDVALAWAAARNRVATVEKALRTYPDRLDQWSDFAAWAAFYLFFPNVETRNFLKTLKLSTAQLRGVEQFAKGYHAEQMDVHSLFEPGAFEGFLCSHPADQILGAFLRWNFQKPKPILSGNEISEKFPTLRGPPLGKVMAEIYELQLRGMITTNDEALKRCQERSLT